MESYTEKEIIAYAEERFGKSVKSVQAMDFNTNFAYPEIFNYITPQDGVKTLAALSGTYPEVWKKEVVYFGNINYQMKCAETNFDYVVAYLNQNPVFRATGEVEAGYTGLKRLPLQWDSIWFDTLLWTQYDESCLGFVGWKITFK